MAAGHEAIVKMKIGMKQRRIGLVAIALAGAMLSNLAHATGDIGCTGVDGSDADIDVNFGFLPVLQILNATITARGKTWSTRPGDGVTEIVAGQSVATGNMLIADFTDVHVLNIIASLRLFDAEEGDDFVRAGTLWIDGHGAHAVVCAGP